MATVAIILFVIAAVFGLIVLLSVLKTKPTPKTAVILHGLFAVSGLLLLVIFSASTIGPVPTASLIFFILAGLLGIILLVNDLATKKVPKFWAVVHPILAAAGLFLLIVFVV